MASGLRRKAAMPRARCRCRGLGSERKCCVERTWRTGGHSADALYADLFLERSRLFAFAECLLSVFRRGLAPWRLDRNRPSQRAVCDLRTIRLNAKQGRREDGLE